MANFNRKGRSGFGNQTSQRRDFKKTSNKKFGDKQSAKVMYRATCSECGISCEVPFKPTGGKPVLCSICFGKEEPQKNNFGKSQVFEKKLFKATCHNCGQLCEVPFKPIPGKQVFCDQCFGKMEPEKFNAAAGNTNEQFRMLNDKLDKILELIGAKPKKNFKD